MSEKPSFSIVIPVYNRADKIMTTLHSVLEQTVQDYECLVIDDGSDDAQTLKAVIEEMNDIRFRYVWQENGGGGAARNTGIIEAKGTYIAFLDSDDLFLPNKLEKCLKQITHDPKHAIYSMMYVDRGVDKMWVRPDRGIYEGEDMGAYLFIDNQFIQTSTIVMHAQTAKDVLFDPELRKGQDLDFCLRLHKHGVRFKMIEEPLTVWVDATETGRTSRTRGYEAPLSWLDRSKHLLTPEAEAGYRATVLFYYMAKHKPMTAMRDLIEGAKVGVPLKVLARQFLRGFVPGRLYRKMVDSFVALSGRKKNA